MRHSVLAVTLVACASLLLAGTSYARIPNLNNSTVSDSLINTCPYAHAPGTGGAAERYVDLVVTLLNDSFLPVEGYPAGNFLSFTVSPHPSYPNLGGGPSGDCAGCEGHYMVSCLDGATNIDGEMNIRVDLGTGCSPSMCCPVTIAVEIVQGTIVDLGEVYQNTFDTIANGDVRGPDFGYFGSAYVSYDPCADYVLSAGETWGNNVSGSDFAAFSTHYKDCCGMIKSDDPENDCDPWTNPCP